MLRERHASVPLDLQLQKLPSHCVAGMVKTGRIHLQNSYYQRFQVPTEGLETRYSWIIRDNYMQRVYSQFERLPKGC